MKPLTDKELLDKVKAREELRNRGYRWKSCRHCFSGLSKYGGWECNVCSGRWGHWEAPLMS